MPVTPPSSLPPSIAGIARDPAWLPHRYDPEHDAIHFLHIPRAVHRHATFLTDDYLPTGRAPTPVLRREAIASAPSPAPLHFVFHSAFCCSTLVARALDIEGRSMGLKEPTIFNDIVGWRRRGGTGPDMANVLDDALTLLARPFAPGEAIVIKPSTVVQGIAAALLTLRPDAHALVLHAPLRTFLSSIAKKGLDGRLWVRTMLLGLLDDNLVPFGFSARDLLGQSDLQVAAIGWLAQHKLFADMVDRFGSERIRSLDSATLTARPGAMMAALNDHFALRLDDAELAAAIDGPAFSRHSKTGASFDTRDREEEHRAASSLHADEIEKVAIWAETVAATMNVALTLPSPLLPERPA